MAASIHAKFESILRETFTSGLDADASLPVDWSVTSEQRVRNASSTPAITAVWSDLVPLVGGAKDIDLTALSRGNLAAALDLTGLKVYYLELWNTGANAMTFTPDGVNGYDVFGASGSLVLGANGRVIIDDPAGYEAVGAAAKVIDVAGTAVQEFWIAIGAGA